MEATVQDRPLTVQSVVRHARAVHGRAEVVTVTRSGTTRATFAEVITRAGALAAGLRALGVGEGEPVGTFLWNCQEHLEAYYGVPAAGAVLHTLNVRLSTAELTAVAEHAGDTVVLVGGTLVERFAPVLAGLPRVHTVVVTGSGDVAPLAATGKRVLRYDDLVAGGPAIDWEADPAERAAVAMCYTSGTTGMPKGVVYSHRSTVLHALSVCSANAVGLSAADRALVLVPMFHANAWGWPYAAFLSGTSLVLTDGDLSPAHVAAVVAGERVTVTGGVPTLWADLLAHADVHPVDLGSLRLVLCGGSAVPSALTEAYRRRFGVPLVQAWGMTEVSPLGAVARPREATDTGDVASSQGRLLYGVEGRVVDEGGAVVPRDGGGLGELQVRGPWVTGSYFRGAGADSFTDDGWLRTGDVGTLDADGVLRISDRRKDVIKSGGEWISSVALEDALTAHPDVVEAAVVGIADARWQERPLAVVVLRPGAQAGPGELRAWLSERVVRWWVPDSWSFVAAVPRTSVGKYDKVRLRSMVSDGDLRVEHGAATVGDQPA
ncbi:long-chain-fatty-acid--CoA ligase [Blastococcus sp. SYSU D00669]